MPEFRYLPFPIATELREARERNAHEINRVCERIDHCELEAENLEQTLQSLKLESRDLKHEARRVEALPADPRTTKKSSSAVATKDTALKRSIWLQGIAKAEFFA